MLRLVVAGFPLVADSIACCGRLMGQPSLYSERAPLPFPSGKISGFIIRVVRLAIGATEFESMLSRCCCWWASPLSLTGKLHRRVTSGENLSLDREVAPEGNLRREPLPGLVSEGLRRSRRGKSVVYHQGKNARAMCEKKIVSRSGVAVSHLRAS